MNGEQDNGLWGKTPVTSGDERDAELGRERAADGESEKEVAQKRVVEDAPPGAEPEGGRDDMLGLGGEAEPSWVQAAGLLDGDWKEVIRRQEQTQRKLGQITKSLETLKQLLDQHGKGVSLACHTKKSGQAVMWELGGLDQLGLYRGRAKTCSLGESLVSACLRCFS